MGRLQSSLGGVAIKDMPFRVQAQDVTVVEFGPNEWIAFIVDLVPGEKLHLRALFASIQICLLVFNLDLPLARLNFRTGRVRSSQTLIQIGVTRMIL